MPRKASISRSGPTSRVKRKPSTVRSADPGKPHTEAEDHPWSRNIPGHEKRRDSPEYIDSRKLMLELQRAYGDPFPYLSGPFQDHHGGGLWVKSRGQWFLYLNFAGIEWSMQFCCDPKKVDMLRRQAKALVDKFPDTISGYEELGYPKGRARQLLDTEITDAAGIASWTDSIFNASVPLSATHHTAILPSGAGVHHYPKPVQDGDFVKRDDFILWNTDEEGKPAAVAPVDFRGSGDGRVQVLYATPGTKLYRNHLRKHAAGEAYILPATHRLAQQAFEKQK